MKSLLFFLVALGICSARAQSPVTFVPLQATWKYLDNGSNQGTAWRAVAFDDTAWAAGPAELGYGDGDEATVVGFGPNSAAKYITTYFRRTFAVTDAATVASAALRVRRDDGVVIYLNGTEIYRSNLPTGTISHTTLATAAIGGADETTLLSATVSPALLLTGTNVLAVEVHQNAASSSDLSFDLELTGTALAAGPVAAPQSVTATEDTPQAIQLSGTDPEGDALTFAIASAPAKGVLTGVPPAVTYTPHPDTNGADTFTFTVSDGTTVSAPATVTLNVAPVNDAPVADAATHTVGEEGTVTFDLSGSDVDNRYGTLPDYVQQQYLANLTAVTDGLSGATYNEDTGTLFFIRNVSTGGGTSYEYTTTGTLLRTITQSGFQDTEAIAWMHGDTYAIAEENNFQRISIVTIAPGATTLARTATGNVTWNTTWTNGTLANLGIESLCYDAGRDLLYYLAEKPAGGTWPIYSMDPQTGVSTVLCDLNASVALAGVATDLSDMAFDRATDTILLLSHESSRIVRVSRDGTVLEQRGFTTAFTQAEALALTADRSQLFVGGEPKQYARYALPAATLTYQLVTRPAHGTLSGIPPRLSYAPAPDYYGTDSFVFRLFDGALGSADTTVTLNITPVNDPPSGSALNAAAEATEPTLIVLPVTDPDGDALTIQATPPAHGVLTVDGVMATYTGDEGYTGPDSFTYTVSDGEFTAGPFTVAITVTAFNFAPVAGAQALTLAEDAPQAVTLVASDEDGDPLTWTIVVPPAHGTLSGTAPNLTYTPAADFHGPDSFTFRVSDGQETSNTAMVSLTVTPVNDAPVAGALAASVEAGYPLPLALAGSDPDGDDLVFNIVQQPVHGTLTGTAPQVTYTAPISHAGDDTFAFTVSDGQLTSAPAMVTVSVAPYNLAPVAGAGSAVTDEDVPVATVLVATDPESSPLTYSIITPPVRGTLTGTAPNLTYTPASNYSGTDSFTWTASDATKTSAPATFAVAVNPVNDAPVALSLTVPTEAGVSAPVNLSGSDVEGTPLGFAVVAPPEHGTLAGTPPALVYTPAEGFTGSDSFTFAASDGELTSAPATITINVTAPALDQLVPAGAVWKYLADGSNQGSAWRTPAFDDAAWPQGPAQLGYGDGGEATVVPFGPDANNRYITTYFRREFTLTNPNVITGPLKLDLVRDDGAVVYLNGTEVFRSNMPAGTVSWNTLASAAVSGADESAFFSTTFSPALLVPGRNVLAVEIHQNAANSSDISFDLRLAETVPAITRGPYVQMTGADRATVRWRTNVAVASLLRYGTTEGALDGSVTDGALKTEHEIHVTGLAPGTRYYYSAGYPLATFAAGPNFHFTTHPPADTVQPYRFWVIGDMGTGTASQTSVRDAFYTWNGGAKVDGVLMLGDNVYETGTDTEYQTRFFDIYATLLRNTTFWPAFGNHDAGNASSATQSGPYYQSFTMPKAGEAGGLPSGTEAYYSFDHGNIHFVCLDSEGTSLSGTGAMAQWLQADLAANWREWTIAYWHHPVYSKGSHDSDNAAADSGKMKNMREVFVPILESHGVDLLLFGHEHAYFRTPLVNGHHGTSTTFDPATMLKQGGLGNPAGDGPYVKVNGPQGGAVFTVAGSSGKLDSRERSMPVLALSLNELGSVVLDVNGRELTSRFLNSSGVVRDTFAIVHNTPPVALAATVAGIEDTALPIVLAATDADSDPLSWEIVTPPAVGTLSGNAPDLIYTPPADFHGTVTLDFRVNDSRTTSATATITLNIAPVNDAPVATAASLTIEEDSAAPIQLSAGDSDGDALTFTVTTLPAHGTLTGTAPDLIYTPDPDWHGQDSFTFTAGDGAATAEPALVTITVTPLNDAPVAAAQTLVTEEDTALSLVLTGTDPDGDPATHAITTQPEHGALSGTAPNLTYIPAADFHGTDRFEFSLSDGFAPPSTAIVTIVVDPVNDRPVAAAADVVTAEDAAAAITLAATDADGDPLSFTVTTPPAHGTLGGSAPNLIYTPDANWHGTDTLTFIVNDGTGDSLPAVVTLTVTPVNDAPTAVDQTLTTSEDTAVAVSLAGADVDGDPLTFAVSVPPAHGTLSGTAPDLVYTPAADFHGADSFAFTVSDGTAPPVAAVVSVTVTAVDDAPVAAGIAAQTMEDTAVTLTLSGSDADGDALTYTLLSQPAHGTLGGTAPSLTYTPDPDWHGADSFTFAVGDGTAVSEGAVVTVEVAPVNDLPVAAAQVAATDEDVPLPLVLSATDADGDPLTFAIATPPAHGRLSGTAPSLTYTPDADWHGDDSFSFTAGDAAGSSVPAVVSIVVARVNDAPAAVALAVEAAEDSAVGLTLSGTDADGDALSYRLISLPAHGTLGGTAPLLSYTPDPDWHGVDSFTYVVSDGTSDSAPATVAVTVMAVNDAPLAAALAAETAEDSPAVLTLSGSDADGDSLTFSVVAPPSRGALSGTPPQLVYTPAADWHGTDSFTYAVSDGSLVSAQAVVTIVVQPVNDPPAAEPLVITVEAGAAASFVLPGTDPDGDALTWQVTASPASGTLSGTPPALTYTPAPGFSGTDSFAWTVSDGSLTSGPFSASLTVEAAGPWHLVVRTGQLLPGAGGAAVSTIHPDFVSDAAGRASFRAVAGSLTGIWTEGPTGLEAVMVQGGAAEGVAGAVFDAASTGPWAAGVGDLLFYGRLLPGVGGVTNSSDYGWWLRRGGVTALVAREDGPAPSLPSGARFATLPAVATLADGGNLAFAASLRTSSSLGVSSANDTGIWATFGQPLRLVVRENNAAPGSTDGGLFDSLSGTAIASNRAGQFAFATALKTGGSIGTANRFGLWLWDPAQFGLVARGGQQAPGAPTGAVFAQPQSPSLGGSLTFRSTLATNAGGVTNSSDTGIWALDNGQVTLFAREGSQAPGLAAGALFNQLNDGSTVNGAGHFTFRASLRTGGPVTSATNAGVWTRSPFTGGTLTIVARRGTPAPGAGSGTFTAFNLPCIAEDGREAFTASLTQNAAAGVTAANDTGLWVRSAAGPLVLALREGERFSVARGDERTVASITLPGTQLSGRSPFSDDGRLMVLIGFTDGTAALCRLTLP